MRYDSYVSCVLSRSCATSGSHLKNIVCILTHLAILSFAMNVFAVSPGEERYKREVLPVLSEYCYDCHADGTSKGDLELDKFKTFDELVKARKFWDGVREHVSTHVMPPEKKPKPTQDHRDAVLNWIEDVVMAVDPSHPDPGHITLRRLNRAEYNNTVRDVFSTELKPAASFPQDDAGYGFDNIGAVLTLSPILMEKYLRAAKQVADDAVWMKAPERVLRSADANDIRVAQGTGKSDEFAWTLYSNGEFATDMRVEREGVYHLVMELAGEQAGDKEGAKYAAFVDNKEIARGEITVPYDRKKKDNGWQRIATDVKLWGGTHHMVVQFLNDGADAANPNPLRRDRNLLLKTIEIAGPVTFETGTRSKFCEWLFEGKMTHRPVLRLEGEDFDPGPNVLVNFSGAAYIATEGFVHRKLFIQRDDEYVFRFRATEDHVE